jgi:hypothetical protein
MRKVSAKNEIHCDVAEFWDIFLDEAYTRALHEELGSKEMEVLERSDTRRRLRVVPKLNMPGPVAKLLGDRFGYEEQSTIDRKKNLFQWKILPNTMQEKLFTQGSMRVEAAGAGRCYRNEEATVEAKVFGIGGLFESSTEKEVLATWSKEAAFMNRWIAKKKG